MTTRIHNKEGRIRLSTASILCSVFSLLLPLTSLNRLFGVSRNMFDFGRANSREIPTDGEPVPRLTGGIHLSYLAQQHPLPHVRPQLTHRHPLLRHRVAVAHGHGVFHAVVVTHPRACRSPRSHTAAYPPRRGGGSPYRCCPCPRKRRARSPKIATRV